MPSEATDPSAASWSIDNLATSPNGVGGEQIGLLDRPRPKAGQSKAKSALFGNNALQEELRERGRRSGHGGPQNQENEYSSLSGARSR
jgi:hypothetical protein